MKYLPNGYENKKLIKEFIAQRIAEAHKLMNISDTESKEEK